MPVPDPVERCPSGSSSPLSCAFVHHTDLSPTVPSPSRVSSLQNELRSITSHRTAHVSSPPTGTDERGKVQGRKQAETFPGDLDVIEGLEWERQDS